MSQVNRLSSNSAMAQHICLFYGEDGGLPCYHYVYVEPHRRKLLERLKNSGANLQVNINSYGKVVMRGYGKPTEDIRRKMKEEFGFEE